MSDINVIINKFQLHLENSLSNKETFLFNISELPEIDNYTKDIRDDENFKEMFIVLNSKVNHCLYWFSLENKEDAFSMKTILDEKRNFLWEKDEDKRKLPAQNKNVNSNVLYVGVRQNGIRKKDGLSNISGRIIQHLGYYYKGSTQGLQLKHWANDFDIQIQLNVIQFEGIQLEYLYVLEKLFALELKPLCGKH